MAYNNDNGLEFHEIPDSVVILRSKGVFKQTKAFLRGGKVYAKHGSGFIMLNRHGTTVPTVMVDGFNIGDLEANFNKLGRLELSEKSRRALTIEHVAKITEAK